MKRLGTSAQRANFAAGDWSRPASTIESESHEAMVCQNPGRISLRGRDARSGAPCSRRPVRCLLRTASHPPPARRRRVRHRGAQRGGMTGGLLEHRLRRAQPRHALRSAVLARRRTASSPPPSSAIRRSPSNASHASGSPTSLTTSSCEITDRAGHPAIICLDDGQGGPNDQRSTRNSSKEESPRIRGANRKHQQGMPRCGLLHF